MRILIDIGHPAHVHFFKHFVRIMQDKGHQILITAREKDVAIKLLNAYGFQYEKVGYYHKRLFTKMVDIFRIDLRMYKVARKFRPDILVSVGSPNAAHVSALLRKPHIAFDDNELSIEQYYIYAPFTDVIFTPSCFKKDLGRKQVRYNGYKELAYLHPNYFNPDPSVLDGLGLRAGDKIVVARFVSWSSSHDVGKYGFGLEEKKALVNKLGEYAKVIITSEAPLPAELEKYKIPVSPERLHHLLYYATMLVSDSGTTSSEAGVLGTPVIRYNSFVGPNDLGFLAALEHKNGLIYSFRELNQAMAKVQEILSHENMKQEWVEKRRKLIDSSIDVTAFLTWFIENYPESFKIMKETPDYQDKFK